MRTTLPLLLLLAPLSLADAPKPPKGFTALFNGKDLTGWHGRNADRTKVEATKHWKVESGELVGDSGTLLTTDAEHGDVELIAEHQQGPKGGGAVYLRGGKVPVEGEKWSRVRIVLVGQRAAVYASGKAAIFTRLENAGPLPRMGPIQLGAGRWRNVFVRAIKSEEANAILRNSTGVGFKDVFNGKDFTGWTGPIDNYEIRDGAIVCKPGKGGNIHTVDEYEDFVARVEYRLPPGGNNGLAIRYPGKGQPSQVAMTEIQVLDDTATKYAKLDPRQYNGSVYGMIPATRGYLRPVGEWNFMEVTVIGHKITVELNGTRIVDGDVSKVTKFKDGTHPGRLRTKGYFGFAGHSDPVAFRLVQIKPLAKASP